MSIITNEARSCYNKQRDRREPPAYHALLSGCDSVKYRTNLTLAEREPETQMRVAALTYAYPRECTL